MLGLVFTIRDVAERLRAHPRAVVAIAPAGGSERNWFAVAGGNRTPENPSSLNWRDGLGVSAGMHSSASAIR